MRELLSFGLGAPEICENTRGFVMAKVWSNVPGGSPRSQRYDLGRKTIQTTDQELIVGDVFSKIQKAERARVIGFSVVMFCGAAKHSASRFERFANFAFTKPDAAEHKVQSLTQKNEDLCEAVIAYDEKAVGILYSVVDFPTTAYEYATENPKGLTVIQAAADQEVAGLALRTNVLLRPSVVRIEGLPGMA